MPETLRAFLEMGGYGVYVWPAYALAAGVLGAMLGVSLKDLRGRRRELERQERLTRARDPDRDGSDSP